MRRAAEAIAGARHLLVLTGAGISAESGIPTFREAQTGLWARFSPQDLATPEAFAENPERIWAWYRWRRNLIARGGANAGHRAIATLGACQPLVVATQNVDGLHAAAGNREVAELHGNIWGECCTRCDAERTVEVGEQTEDAPPPTCPACGAMTRPAVVWFGEMLPMQALEQARHALDAADCVLVVGTSNQVYPAAALAEQAIESQATVIEINPRPTALSQAVDMHLAETASRALPALVSLLDGQTSPG